MSPSASGAESAVRRWLQLGAASAGMGAALIGWSLLGPHTNDAAADSGVGSSSSAGPTAASAKGAGTAKPGAGHSARVATPRTVNRTTVAPGPNRVAAPSVVAAGKGDPLGALGKFLPGALKELLNRKTLLNPLQRLDDLTPKQKGLLDLIPKIPVAKENSLWYRQVQASEAERQRRADANARQLDEIMKTGMKLTAHDGTDVYTVDGRTFVKYTKVFADRPPQPTLFRLSDQLADRNADRVIRNSLKLDPAQVRRLWKK